MKNSFLIFSALLWLSTFCSAQNKITTGIQAKVGLSNYWVQEEWYESQNLTTFGGGLYVDLPVSRSFSVRPQMGWLRKGFQNNSQGTSAQFMIPIDSRLSLDYLFLDLTLMYRARVNKAWRPFIQFGVRESVLVSSRYIEMKQVIYHPELNNFRRLTVGGLTAIGMEWNRFSFGLEANYDISTYLSFKGVNPRLGWYGVNLSYQLRSF